VVALEVDEAHQEMQPNKVSDVPIELLGDGHHFIHIGNLYMPTIYGNIQFIPIIILLYTIIRSPIMGWMTIPPYTLS